MTVSFKSETKAEKLRKKIAEGILRSDPGSSDERKFAIASAQAKNILSRKKKRRK